MEKQSIKAVIVLAVLGGLIIFLGGIGSGQPWWFGFIFLALLLGIGIPIAVMLTWWINK